MGESGGITFISMLYIDGPHVLTHPYVGHARGAAAFAAVAIMLGAALLHAPAVAQSSAPIQTVFVIVMENHNWSEILNNPSAPYINGLLRTASHAEQYFTPPGVRPSTPNYLWMESGQDFGLTGVIGSTPGLHHQSTTNHLVTQLKNAGLSWKAYQEDIDGTLCPLSNQNLYVPRHNPFVYFDDVTNTNDPGFAYCIAHVRPYSELATDLARNSVALYSFITPNLCNDMHDCSIGAGDAWLSREVPTILSSLAYSSGGAVFITWDEGTASASDGPIGLIVLSPVAKGNGYFNTLHYTHSSLLLTLQEIFGVRPLLGDAARATDLSDLFANFPAVVPSTPSPADTTGGVGANITLGWSSSGGSDDVYFGISNPPPLVATGVSTRSYAPPRLSAGATYFWQIVSKTSAGTTPSPVWRFTTATATLPNPWADGDIGAVGLPGNASDANNTVTVTAAGADIWGTADAFHYVYQPLAADGQIVVRVTSLQNTNTFAKAGVMFRNTLEAGSAHVILDIKPNGGVEFMQRSTAGGTTAYLGGTTVAFPAWLRLTRSGSTLSGAVSSNGTTWTTVGSTTMTVNGSTFVGLTVTSHTTGALTTAAFDNVTVTSSLAPTPTSPNPASGGTGVSTSPTLTWSAPGATSYDISFGTTNPPLAAATGLTTAAYPLSGLAAATTYFWQIVAHSGAGSTTGPVWSFTTTGPPTPSGNVVIYASDIPSTALHGTWSAASDPRSPQGIKLVTPDNGWSTTTAPLAAPTDYFDVMFNANAGTPYTIWLRLQALNNSKFNDSVWVQFSDATANGPAIYRMNTIDALLVNLATDGTGSSNQAWGWQNRAYWLSQPTTLSFSTNGPHTLRIQVREDGVQLDQIVLSPSSYLNSAPGPVSNDSTIVPKQP